jgi:hypothetical protein
VADLFALQDLAAFMQQDLDTATATACRTAAQGAILGAVRQAELPNPVPAFMAFVGMRVAARLYANPTGSTSETVGTYSVAYAAQLMEPEDKRLLGQLFGVGTALSVTFAN